MNFEGFYGNERAKAYLSSAFARNSLPHALLITGEEGIGKKTLANIIARTLVCTGENSPCDKCDACYKSKKGIHPDIIYLGSEDDTVKVDDIRALKRDALLRPNDGDRKVYIINHAEAMTHQAQDAFLKILEEPPLFTFFIILCYNLSDILPTIVSRTAHITLAPLSDSDMRRIINEKLPDITENACNELIKTSGGVCSFLITEKNREFTDIATNIANALISHDELEIFRAINIFEKRDRDSVSEILRELIIIFRDSCVLSSQAESTLLSSADSKIAQRISETYSVEVCSKIIRILSDAPLSCIQNVGVSHIAGSLTCKLADIAAKRL